MLKNLKTNPLQMVDLTHQKQAPGRDSRMRLKMTQNA